MKTSITTIALFSLVLVATSFTTTETTNISLNTKNEIIPPIDGGSTGGGRKQDGYTAALLSTNNFRLPIDGGSTGGGRKQDGYAQVSINLSSINAASQSAEYSRKID